MEHNIPYLHITLCMDTTYPFSKVILLYFYYTKLHKTLFTLLISFVLFNQTYTPASRLSYCDDQLEDLTSDLGNILSHTRQFRICAQYLFNFFRCQY